MKIISLQTESFKRIKAVSIKPDGSIIEVTGENGAGKSSLLDSIWAALGGKDAVPTVPIRRGESEAIITLALGDNGETKYKVTRKFRATEEGGYTTSLIVENADGFRSQKPQDLLNGLLGALTFDPLAFTRMKPAEQVDILKGFVPGVNFDEIAAKNKKDYDERTALNRDIKSVTAQIAVAAPSDPAPENRIDETALIEELDGAGVHNQGIEKEKAKRADTAKAIQACHATAKRSRDNAAQIDQQIADLLRRKAGELASADEDDKLAAEWQSQYDALPALPAPIDTTGIKAKIETARRNNSLYDAAARQQQARDNLAKKATELQASADALTKRIDAREELKRKAIAEANMPVPGLAFGQDGVLLNGVPFEQGSHAEQLRASVAIAAAMNPKLKVIRIADGSLLSQASMQLLADHAEKHGLQIWVETVASGRPGAIVIEDGHVANNPIAVAAE